MRVNLIEMRKKFNKTQEEVASDLGISRAFYGMIEQNTRNPTLYLAEKIAKYFNSTVDDIFFEKLSYETKRKNIS